MKAVIPSAYFVLCICLFAVGCSNTTGQEAEDREFLAADEYGESSERRAERSDDNEAWAEHRKNFGNQPRASRFNERERERSERVREYSWEDEDWDSSSDETVDIRIEGLEESIEVDLEGLEEGLEEALSQIGNALEEVGNALNDGASVESVSSSDLKAVLPDKLRGMEREYSNSEKVGVLGLSLTNVEQVYVDEDDGERIEIKLVDMGSLAATASAGLDWLDVNIDAESSDGFERTTTLEGYPAMEECTGKGDHCSIHMFIADRFMIQIDAKRVDIGRLHRIIKDMDLKKLEELRDYGM